jgi:hypothetical protein
MKRCSRFIDRAVLGVLVLAQSAVVYAQQAATEQDEGLQEVV